MIHLLDDEEKELRSAVRTFLDRRAPLPVLRTSFDAPGGYSESLWRELANEMGVVWLGLPGGVGGIGGVADRGLVAEEFGYRLVPAPYVQSALAADVLAALVDNEHASQILEDLAGGGSVVVAREPLPVDAEGMATGLLEALPQAHTATTVLFPGQTDHDHERVEWFATGAGQPGATLTARDSLDPTTLFADLHLAGAAVTRLGTLTATDFSSTLDRARAINAAHQIGGMRRALDLALEHIKVRTQFDRVVGSFQAVKQQAANIAMLLELASSIARAACVAADEDPSSLPELAAICGGWIGPKYVQAAQDCIRLLGGVGYTWEHDAHLYFKHAAQTMTALDTPRAARSRVADSLEHRAEGHLNDGF